MLEDGIPEVEEQMASKLWEAVRRHADEEQSSMATPPFSFINLDDETSFHWEERKVMHENKEIPPAYRSKKVPSHLTYGGRSEHNSYIITAPSLHRPGELLKEKNVLRSLLSIPISCTLTLEGVLRRQPHLWSEVANFLVSKRSHTHSNTLLSCIICYMDYSLYANNPYISQVYILCGRIIYCHIRFKCINIILNFTTIVLYTIIYNKIVLYTIVLN